MNVFPVPSPAASEPESADIPAPVTVKPTLSMVTPGATVNARPTDPVLLVATVVSTGLGASLPEHAAATHIATATDDTPRTRVLVVVMALHSFL
jgi:hypothetical protein